MPQDLRLKNPWPELINYVKSMDLDNMDSSSLSEIPYIVLIIHVLLKVSPAHAQNSQEADDCAMFRKIMEEYKGKCDSENIEEASSNSWKAFKEYKVFVFFRTHKLI